MPQTGTSMKSALSFPRSSRSPRESTSYISRLAISRSCASCALGSFRFSIVFRPPFPFDRYDIQYIRDKEYRLGGWSYDPFPEIEDEEDEDEEEEWHYRSIEEQLWEVGMSMMDFLYGMPSLRDTHTKVGPVSCFLRVWVFIIPGIRGRYLYSI